MDTNSNAYLADFGFLPIVPGPRTAPYLLTAIGSSVRWAAPWLFEISESANGPQLQLTMQIDLYLFGSIMLQVLFGNIPYHAVKRDDQVLYTIAKGTRSPETSNVADKHWEFIQQCWSSRQENKHPYATDISAFLAAHNPG
ncbi:hypothetical protein PAXRUDRAFT_13093 [Paxillus rubicundulus Ve08.2h10]|uniref:Protein kinase domain-containing protein n=1 Tax=Paxillus rubicundulus Ve08.2h10 TaxID=930991 RepID=A0A0D0DUF7_9AGAM|nr:hypothetical protein PAXRUDRAFT_13093 [Paxillus rubicundulus Ve08.2h10]